MLKDTTVVGNPLWRPVALFCVLLAAMLVGKIVQMTLHKASGELLKRDKWLAGFTAKVISKSIVFLTFAVGLQQGVNFLLMSEKVAEFSSSTTSVIMALAIGWLLYCAVEVVDAWLGRFADKTASKMDDMLVPMVRKSLRVTITVLVLVQVAQILSDKPITSILAGLGVGGLAVALAAQDTIKNFFGSLVILADKPFEVGDRIVIDGHDGPVEEVGFRSTRIRTLEGHLVTVPNGELANKTVHNIGKRPYIRRLMNVTVTYDTPLEKIERGVEILKELLENHEGMHKDFPPRVYFNDFNAASLNIIVIYWYHPPDYWAYMEYSEKLNKEIFKRFGDEGIDFAFPTQTLYLAGDPARPLQVGIARDG